MLGVARNTMTKLAVGQICSTADISHNLSQCLVAARKAADAGAKALFLPEASDYIASSAAESVSLAVATESSPFVLGLQEAAREYAMAINVGIHEPTNEGSRVKNTLLWIDQSGNITQRYQKLHMFDVEIRDGPVLKESDSVEPGSSLVLPFPSPVGHIGMLICFDLRFPEPSLRLSQADPRADIITYPSAFTVPTGRAHWSPLLRARAIETQSYVVAAAQVGQHNEKRTSYGRSTVVDPWGAILIDLDGAWTGEPIVGVCDIKNETLDWARKQVPLKRRWDVYGRC